MKSNPVMILGLTLLAGLLAVGAPRAPRMRPRNCEVPAYLLTTESTLPKVATAVKGEQPAGYAGGGQPVLDHPVVRRPAPIPAGCRRSEGEAAEASRSTYP